MSNQIDPKYRIKIEPPPTRNPESLKKHRQQSFWQIIFPVILTFIIIVAVVVGIVILGGTMGASAAADYSLILLIIPILVIGLVLLAVNIGLIVLVNKGLKAIPQPAFQIQNVMKDVHSVVDDATDKVAGVVIQSRSTMAGITHGLKREGIITDDDLRMPPELGGTKPE